MMFTIAFPTLASAMTGYTGIVKAYVPEFPGGNQITFNSFAPVLYIIHDGERIAKTKEYVVVAGRSYYTYLSASDSIALTPDSSV